MSTWFLVILILAILLVIPAWPYSRGWGYFPAGGLGLLLIVLLLLAFLG